MTTIQEHNARFIEHADAFQMDVDIPSDGFVGAEIAIIGEGGGEQEFRQGKPFMGRSGTLLFDALRKHGINRSNTFVTNVAKCQISLNRTGSEKHHLTTAELDNWEALLRWEIKQLPNCRILFLLGNYAMNAVLRHRNVTNWRGSVMPWVMDGKEYTVVIANNPAYAIRDLKIEPIFLLDCAKLGMVVNGTFKPHKINAIINPTAKEAIAYLGDLRRSSQPVAFDIELAGGETACYGFANQAHEAICINVRDVSHNKFTLSEEADILNAIQDLCDHQQIIAQNGSFDAYWTRLHDRLDVKMWFDTLLAHHTLYPQLPHNLGFLTSQYTTHPFYKDEGTAWKDGGDINEFWEYNCKDCAITWAVHRALKRELEKQKLDRFFFDHVMRAQPHLISATVHGVAVDLEVKERIEEQVSEDVMAKRQKFFKLVQEATHDPDYWPNPGSSQQLQELFFSRLNLRGRGRSTDKRNREHIVKNPNTPAIAREMIRALDDWASDNKFLTTYARARVSDDGRMRCDYKQYGVQSAPGRLSSSGLLDGTGINLQNQPPRAREMYKADDGLVFVYFDLAQAEARIVAWRANIPVWIEQFERARHDGKYDAHRALAAEMFKLPYDEVPSKDFADAKGRIQGQEGYDETTATYTKRYIAKRCRHGLNYRMERFRLSEVTGLPFYEAARAFSLYHTATPELNRWWDAEERVFRKTKTAFNAYGRRNRIIQRLDEDVLRSIVAFYPQSTVGDKVTQVWYMAEEDDKWPIGARVCLDVHDNLVALAKPCDAKTCLHILKRHAETAIPVIDCYGNIPDVETIIPADLKMSIPDAQGIHRWSNMKEVVL